MSKSKKDKKIERLEARLGESEKLADAARTLIHRSNPPRDDQDDWQVRTSEFDELAARLASFGKFEEETNQTASETFHKTGNKGCGRHSIPGEYYCDQPGCEGKTDSRDQDEKELEFWVPREYMEWYVEHLCKMAEEAMESSQEDADMYGYGTRTGIFHHRMSGMGFAMSNISLYLEAVEAAKKGERALDAYKPDPEPELMSISFSREEAETYIQFSGSIIEWATVNSNLVKRLQKVLDGDSETAQSDIVVRLSRDEIEAYLRKPSVYAEWYPVSENIKTQIKQELLDSK